MRISYASFNYTFHYMYKHSQRSKKKRLFSFWWKILFAFKCSFELSWVTHDIISILMNTVIIVVLLLDRIRATSLRGFGLCDLIAQYFVMMIEYWGWLWIWKLKCKITNQNFKIFWKLPFLGTYVTRSVVREGSKGIWTPSKKKFFREGSKNIFCLCSHFDLIFNILVLIPLLIRKFLKT